MNQHYITIYYKFKHSFQKSQPINNIATITKLNSNTTFTKFSLPNTNRQPINLMGENINLELNKFITIEIIERYNVYFSFVQNNCKGRVYGGA